MYDLVVWVLYAIAFVLGVLIIKGLFDLYKIWQDKKTNKNPTAK